MAFPSPPPFSSPLPLHYSFNNQFARPFDAGNRLLAHPALQGGTSPDGTSEILPPGFKFRPTDEELIVNYLVLENLNVSSPQRGLITHADVYGYEPQLLSGLVEKDHGDGKMYFYTRTKKHGTSRTDRTLKSKKGSWKPTQAPKVIKCSRTGIHIGLKTPLAYYHGKNKTQWLMQEYKLQSRTSHQDQQLVLAVVYFHSRKTRGSSPC